MTFLGYLERPPWLWLVDLDSRAIAPANTSLPGNDVAVSRISPRSDWLAVMTHSVLWSVPLNLDGPGRRLRETFTFVPSLDSSAVWVESRVRRRDRLIAVDRDGRVMDEQGLPEGWRLHAHTPGGLVLLSLEHGRLATFDAGELRPLVDHVEAIEASSGNTVVWRLRDDSRVLGLTDVVTGGTREIRHSEVAEWQRSASFSPDGKYLAIGGYPTPPEPPSASITEAIDQPYRGRRALVMLVDSTTGACQQVQGEFDNFAWTPAWSMDGSRVVFGAPFESRRLYSFEPDEAVLHALKFRRQPPMPMLDVTDRIVVSLAEQ